MNVYKYILKRAFKGGFFVLFFLALVQPFGINKLNEGRVGYILMDSLLTFFSILFSLLVTKVVLGDYEKRSSSLRFFLVREVVLYIVNTPVLAFLLLAFDCWFAMGCRGLKFYADEHFTLYNMLLMCVYVAVVTVFIFLRVFYEFRNNQLRRELDDVKAINALLEKRQEELFQEKEESGEEGEKSVTVVIEGQGLGARLEVDPSNILYVESMANYAEIYYISENETRHFTLRITLKQIKETLSDFGYIVQCHRAFLVNIHFVVSMTARSPGYQLQLFGVEKQLPVSRANNDVIKSALSEK